MTTIAKWSISGKSRGGFGDTSRGQQANEITSCGARLLCHDAPVETQDMMSRVCSAKATPGAEKVARKCCGTTQGETLCKMRSLLCLFKIGVSTCADGACGCPAQKTWANNHMSRAAHDGEMWACGKGMTEFSAPDKT
jgi:hypothetical protein